MKKAYVVMTEEDFILNGFTRRAVLAVCPDEKTADDYMESTEFECVVVTVPMMESSEKAVR